MRGASGTVCERTRALRPALARALCAALAAAAAAPEPAGATIYFRSSATAQTGGAASLTVTRPANVVSGDVMVAMVAAEGSAGFTAPEGWSSTGLFAATTNVGYGADYFKVATAAEPASYTWSLGSSRKAVARIVDYTGVSTAAPIEASASGGGVFGLNISAPGVTTTVANSMVLLDFSASSVFGEFTITTPAGTTQRAAANTSFSGSQVRGVAQDQLRAAAGATGSYAFKTSALTSWSSLALALSPAAGALAFGPEPQTPALPEVKLSGALQSTHAQMANFSVNDTTGSGAGWNVTVAGQTGTGKSAVFKAYCSKGSEPCGSTPANSYVSGGAELPSGSLTLSTSGASWATGGGAGGTPEFKCNVSACALDGASATKVASAAAKAGEGPWSASGFGAQSLTLSTPSTTRVLATGEIYRVNLLWTLSSGP